jgi:hypothetical protein
LDRARFVSQIAKFLYIFALDKISARSHFFF